MTKESPELHSIKLLVENSSIIKEGLVNEKPSKYFNSKFGKLVFSGIKQYRIYSEESENLYYKIKEISNFFSKKNFEKYLFTEFIPILKDENRIAVENDIKLFATYFKKQNIENYKISREIYGLDFKGLKITLGQFSIINSLLNKEIYDKFKKLCDEDEIPKYLIEVNIKAKDISKAKEIANLKFEQFENIIAFMVGDLSRKKNIKILNNLDTSSQQIFIISSNKIHHQQKQNYSLIIDIDDNYFIDNQNGNAKIWQLFSNDKTSDLEKRIINAIEWAGKALKDDNEAKVLIQFMFAIECALHIQPKNTIINSSILSLISDNIAFLLYDDFDNRKMISSTFKDLYQKRSDIVHGSSQNVKSQDLNKAFHLCKSIVKKLLTDETYLTFSTAEKLGEHLTNQKFK